MSSSDTWWIERHLGRLGRLEGLDLVVAANGNTERAKPRPDLYLDALAKLDLKADEATLRRRLEDRAGHFAGPSLLTSQLAALEEPADGLTIDATRPPEEIVDAIDYELGL